MSNLDKKSLIQLETFVKFIKAHPEALHSSDLKFFKDYLLSLNAVIPPLKSAEPSVEEFEEEVPEKQKSHASSTSTHEKQEATPPPPPPQTKAEKQEEHTEKTEPEEPEEPEEEDPHRVKPDTDSENIEMGDKSKIVSEDEEGDAFSLMSQGRKAAKEGNHIAAIEKLTEAIKLNPQGSALFATRAESFVELKRPNAAIKDCNRALELNPDSGKALKTRGKALRLLGKYMESYHDMQQGNLLDWDEGTDVMIKEIKERAEKAIVKQRKVDEKRRMDELKREAAEKRRRQQEDEDRRNREAQEDAAGGAGGMDAMLNSLFAQLSKDPEVAAALKKPQTKAKLMAFFTNQGSQYADDPDVKKVLAALQKQMPGFGAPGAGAGAGPGGGAGGHGHAHGHAGHAHPHPPSGTDDLD